MILHVPNEPSRKITQIIFDLGEPGYLTVRLAKSREAKTTLMRVGWLGE